MKSRVYWNCLMNETILVQELHLPPSGLARLEEFVPIPKFIPFETAGFVSASLFSLSGDIDDSFFQYHFLAQVAHRIILTRIRHSLYFYCTYPCQGIHTHSDTILTNQKPTQEPSRSLLSTQNFITNWNNGVSTSPQPSNSPMMPLSLLPQPPQHQQRQHQHQHRRQHQQLKSQQPP